MQGGDWTNAPSRVLAASNDGSTIYVKTAPRDWGGTGEAPATMEEWITLEGDLARVRFRFEYLGKRSHAPRDQEVPAFFVDASLSELVYYTGKAPWTGGEVTRVSPVALDDAGHGAGFTFTESWVAYVDPNAWGVGVYKQAASRGTSYRAGAGGTPASTSYVALLDHFPLSLDRVVDYTLYLRVGRIDEIRGAFRDLHQRGL